MTLQQTRPEDRSRQGLDSPAWADTLPACFRSEGFAEDLHEAPTGQAAGADGDRFRWLRDATLPVLGVTLAGAMGLLAR